MKLIILLSQYTPFGNSKRSYVAISDTFINKDGEQHTQSDLEASRINDLLEYFDRATVASWANKTVLDFGCGFGGKSVALAEKFPSATVLGVEPHQHKIAAAKEFASRRGVSNCVFKLCTQTSIPLEDSSVDIVVSHDVIEHVHFPEKTIEELCRVLKPGGSAFLVFPPYKGAIAHHLDFITLVPGLHWIWSAETIMETVNIILKNDEQRRFKCPPQPLPTFSPYAGKSVLPSLNGLGTNSFVAIVREPFDIVSIERTSIFEQLTRFGISLRLSKIIGLCFLKLLPWFEDQLSFSLVVRLRKNLSH